MNLKEVKPAKNCSICKNFMTYRNGDGRCGLDGTEIKYPGTTVCIDKKFVPRIVEPKRV